MRSSLVSRRVLGLAAAGVVGLSTAALPGVALADDAPAASSPAASSPEPSSSQTTAPDPEVLAATPAAPYLNGYPAGVDGGLDLDFVDQSVAPDLATSFEGRADGGAWTALTQVEVQDGRTYGVLGGLTNGSTYAIQVRAVNSSGPSAASNTIHATAYKPVGAPTAVTVSRSATGVTVSWADPTTAGTFPVDFFSVGYSGANHGDEGCRVPATVHTCTFALLSGEDYGLTVLAMDDHENASDLARTRSGAVAAPAGPTAVPTKDDGDITGPAGAISRVTAGQAVVLQGAGYLPGSTVRLTVFSSPVELGTAVVATDGTFTATVTLPANLPNGTHNLVATGYAQDGTARNLVITVTVDGGVAVATLARTGFDAVPVAVGGGLVVLAGAGLALGGRRRKA